MSSSIKYSKSLWCRWQVEESVEALAQRLQATAAELAEARASLEDSQVGGPWLALAPGRFCLLRCAALGRPAAGRGFRRTGG